MQIMLLIFMFVMGAALGSFLCCQAERMHLKDIKKPVKNARSICLHCRKKLKWYDNIPIVSWAALRGKCRFCHKKIGVAEVIAEVLGGVALLLIAMTINIERASAMEWVEFGLVTVFTLVMLFLAIYDGLYGEMPTLYLTISVICAILTVIPRLGAGQWFLPVLGGGLYGGIYLLLYIVSKGKWVGDGDWVLGLSIGLALGTPWLAVCSLFLANLSACLVMLPFLKKMKKRQIYFGPFMVGAFVIVYAFSDYLNMLIV